MHLNSASRYRFRTAAMLLFVGYSLTTLGHSAQAQANSARESIKKYYLFRDRAMAKHDANGVLRYVSPTRKKRELDLAKIKLRSLFASLPSLRQTTSIKRFHQSGNIARVEILQRTFLVKGSPLSKMFSAPDRLREDTWRKTNVGWRLELSNMPQHDTRHEQRGH